MAADRGHATGHVHRRQHRRHRPVARTTDAWTTGQYVQGSTAGAPGEMYWNGTTWVTGRAT